MRIVKVTIEKKKLQPFLNAPVDEMRKTVTMKTTPGTVKINGDGAGTRPIHN